MSIPMRIGRTTRWTPRSPFLLLLPGLMLLLLCGCAGLGVEPWERDLLAEPCVEAGILATLAMLEGRRAETFLAEQGGQYWIVR